MLQRTMAAMLVLVILAACGGAEPVAQAPAPTVAPPSTTFEPTKVALKDLDLESLAIQSGDLPSGFTGAQIRDVAPDMFKEAPTATKTLYQQLERGGKTVGGVTILVYDDAADATTAYDAVRDGMSDGAIKDVEIGDKASVAAEDLSVVKYAEGVVVRCNATFHARFTETDKPEEVTAYLKRLDKRLQPLVCP